MTVSVLLEHVNDNAFRASVFGPTPLVAEAATREQAVDRIKSLIQERLAHAEMIQVEVTPSGAQDSWTPFAGCWRDHPDAAEFEQNMKEYRDEVDGDPQRL